jgi:hypothetical protein
VAEKGRQINIYKSQYNADVLRGKDIIPGAGRTVGEDEVANQPDIPRFDLAEDIMAEQRRLTAVRRKGPSSIIDTTCPSAPERASKIANREPSHLDSIITDIVARDIERLYVGDFQ